MTDVTGTASFAFVIGHLARTIIVLIPIDVVEGGESLDQAALIQIDMEHTKKQRELSR